MSLNGYSYVEGNPIMYTDPSGLQVTHGCGNKPCSDFLSEMFEYIVNAAGNFTKGLAQRYNEMLQDDCFEYERSINYPSIPPNLPAKCASLTTEWKGHTDAFDDMQQGRNPQKPGGLEKAIRCYETKGMQKFNATGDDSDTCNRGHPTYLAALAWLALDSSTFKNSRQGGSPPPSTPPAPSIILDIPAIGAGQFTEVPIAAPEPPPPYGRGSDIPARADCGILCDMALIGVAGAVCLPIAVGVGVSLPKLVPAGGAICGSNPQLCFGQ